MGGEAPVLPLSMRPQAVAVPDVPLGGRRALRPRRARLRFHWRRYAVLLAAMYCCAVARTEITSYIRVRAQLHALRMQEQALSAQHAGLLSAVARAQTPAFVAATARQELGYVGAGQVPLAPIQSGGGDAGGSSVGQSQSG